MTPADDAPSNKCRICNGLADSTFTIREAMFGEGDEFQYYKCGTCGCLQIASIPPDMGRFYTGSYYSVPQKGLIKAYLRRQRLKYIATNRGLLGRIALIWLPKYDITDAAPVGIDPSMRLLEVGCGNGYYLQLLYELGFRKLRGIDPYMDKSVVSNDPFPLQRISILDMAVDNGPYDAIIYGHTFEHIAEQHETLEKTNELLVQGGTCLLRLPVCDSYAWEYYGTDWVQLDAPRHFFIHTRRSLEFLAAKHGFKIARVIYDSTEFQFWGSEQNRKSISLRAPNSWAENPGKSIFTEAQIQQYRSEADRLNREERGDQIAIYLVKE